MSTDRVEELLEKLSSGDDAAAEQVFRAYEPFLRKVVHRLLTPSLQRKFDSGDVVQSVWADILQGFREGRWQFQDANQLRAFLIRVTRNRLIDRIRQTGRAVEREQSLTPNLAQVVASADPRPSEQVQASDLWERLLQQCPAQHRELLCLRREGRTLTEIAERTGMHPDSVRRILRNLAREAALAGGLPGVASDSLDPDEGH
jgi:RNA polymerase sigma-70 factor (ECF subfamily)